MSGPKGPHGVFREMHAAAPVPKQIEDRPLTIGGLETAEQITASDVVATLWDYAESEAHIRGLAITSAIDRANPTRVDLEDMQAAAIEGIVEQARNRRNSTPSTVNAEQAEYAHVIGRISLMLRDLPK